MMLVYWLFRRFINIVNIVEYTRHGILKGDSLAMSAIHQMSLNMGYQLVILKMNIAYNGLHYKAVCDLKC